jgi:hypothetical protein
MSSPGCLSRTFRESPVRMGSREPWPDAYHRIVKKMRRKDVESVFLMEVVIFVNYMNPLSHVPVT